jgi:putative oxidoreductase
MNIGVLLLRLAAGLTLAAHGSQKLFGWFGGYGLDGTGGFLEQLGFTPGKRQAAAAGLAEMGGGLLLALGFLTPLAAALVGAVMLVAAASVHLKNGFFATGGGFEYNLVLGTAGLSLAFTGPGTLSLDGALGLPLAGLGWGIAAVVVALVGGGAQLARRQRPSAAGDHRRSPGAEAHGDTAHASTARA